MRDSRYPYISIIIPSYNSASTVGNAIKTCLEQDYPSDRFEVVVVDDGSKDNTKEVAENFPVCYIYQKRKGPAAARNTGWGNSKGEGLCFIDADCVPCKDLVSKLAQHYGRDKVVAVAGSYAVDGSRYLLDKFVHYEIRYRHSRMPEYINSFGTYNVLIKRSILEEIGGFDPKYYNASGEDSDLAYRIIKAGYKIYFEKEALVSHRNILRLRKYISVQFRHGYWRMKLYKKNSTMIMKDEYGYWKDIVEISLVIVLVSCLILNFQGRFLVAGLLAASLFVIQLPLAVRIAISQKDIRYTFFSFITFIRAFVRVLGGILGFIKFWIIKI